VVEDVEVIAALDIANASMMQYQGWIRLQNKEVPSGR
jgi:hypothetical protein